MSSSGLETGEIKKGIYSPCLGRREPYRRSVIKLMRVVTCELAGMASSLGFHQGRNTKDIVEEAVM